MSRSDEQPASSAIVIGGSIAGLLTARVLSDFFDDVTIIERDTLPETPQPRKGVPQGRHAHALLGNGLRIIEDLFPGMSDELVRLGAPRGHGRFFSGGGYHRRSPNSLKGIFVSRPVLEFVIHQRVSGLDNVSIIERCDAQGLVADTDGERVNGVRVVHHDQSSLGEVLSADLVVDAGGRGSRAPAWLEALGYTPPEVELVEVRMGYTSRFYRREPDHLDGDVFVNIAPTPDNPRASGMMAQEGDRWLVTLAGYFEDYPPTDDAGMLAFAAALPAPEVHQILSFATPLTDPVPYRFRANQRRYYEKLNRFPEGFLVLGDAICSFTPIYGQGMSVAAGEALALRSCLDAGHDRLAQRFFSLASKVIDNAWTITVGNDKSLRPEDYRITAPERLIGWYMGKLQAAARHDTSVALGFQRVANLLDAPTALLKPGIAVRVLRGSIFPHHRARTNPAAKPVSQDAGAR